jgi:hypothetical protein
LAHQSYYGPHVANSVERELWKMPPEDAGPWRIRVADDGDAADSKPCVCHEIADEQWRPGEKVMILVFLMKATAPTPVFER